MLIGAIGCSGAAGLQDEVACTVGAATINKYCSVKFILAYFSIAHFLP